MTEKDNPFPLERLTTLEADVRWIKGILRVIGVTAISTLILVLAQFLVGR